MEHFGTGTARNSWRAQRTFLCTANRRRFSGRRAAGKGWRPRDGNCARDKQLPCQQLAEAQDLEPRFEQAGRQPRSKLSPCLFLEARRDRPAGRLLSGTRGQKERGPVV